MTDLLISLIKIEDRYFPPHCGALMILAPPHHGKGRHTFQCRDCDRLDPLKTDQVMGWLKSELQPPT